MIGLVLATMMTVGVAANLCVDATLPALTGCDRLVQIVGSGSEKPNATVSACLDCAFEACTRSSASPNATCANLTVIDAAWSKACVGHKISDWSRERRWLDGSNMLSASLNASCSLLPRAEVGAADRCRCSCSVNNGTDFSVGSVVSRYTHQSCFSCCTDGQRCVSTAVAQRCTCDAAGVCAADAVVQNENNECGALCEPVPPSSSSQPSSTAPATARAVSLAVAILCASYHTVS